MKRGILLLFMFLCFSYLSYGQQTPIGCDDAKWDCCLCNVGGAAWVKNQDPPTMAEILRNDCFEVCNEHGGYYPYAVAGQLMGYNLCHFDASVCGAPCSAKAVNPENPYYTCNCCGSFIYTNTPTRSPGDVCCDWPEVLPKNRRCCKLEQFEGMYKAVSGQFDCFKYTSPIAVPTAASNFLISACSCTEPCPAIPEFGNSEDNPYGMLFLAVTAAVVAVGIISLKKRP